MYKYKVLKDEHQRILAIFNDVIFFLKLDRGNPHSL